MKCINVSYFNNLSDSVLTGIVRAVEARYPGCAVWVEIDPDTEAPLYIAVEQEGEEFELLAA